MKGEERICKLKSVREQCEFDQNCSLYYLNFLSAIILLSELSDGSNINKFLCLFDCVIS
jgi:hypothetical protein